MSDRELLEMAAKAEGRDPPIDANGVWSAWVGSAENGHWWNPLKDDGDALRLAVSLNFSIEIQPHNRSLISYSVNGRPGLLGNSSAHSAEENLRRAIVRAAAEIGRSLP